MVKTQMLSMPVSQSVTKLYSMHGISNFVKKQNLNMQTQVEELIKVAVRVRPLLSQDTEKNSVVRVF